MQDSWLNMTDYIDLYIIHGSKIEEERRNNIILEYLFFMCTFSAQFY